MLTNTNYNKKKRVAIYCRVSTDEQVQHGNGLEMQKDALVNYVKNRDFEYTLNERNIYIDEGKSGANRGEEERPGLFKMLLGAKNKEFDVLLVWKIDRFFRKTLYLLEGVEALNELGVGFISITQNFDTTQAFGKMMLQMMGVIAELERDLIKERTQSGILTSMKKGKWVRGSVPYGYIKNEDGFLEIDEEESGVVKMIYSLLIDKGYTLNKIVNKLNSLGINTSSSKGKLGSKKLNNLKHKNFWHRSSVQRVLTSDVYKGKLIQNRYIKGRKDKERKERPKEEWLISDCPQIVNENVFNQAQIQMHKNKRYSQRNKKSGVVYMLSTLLYDKETGYKFSGYLSSKKTINYRLDINNKSKGKILPKGVSGTKLDSAVWGKIRDVISSPELFLEELEKMKLNSNNDEIEREIGVLKAEKWKLEKSNKNLLRLAIDLDSETIEDVKIMIEENKEKIKNIDNELESLGKLVLSDEMKKRQLDDLHKLSEKLVSNIDSLSYKEKTEICRILIDKVVMDGDSLEIILMVPNVVDSTKKDERMDIVNSFMNSDNSFLSKIKTDTDLDLTSKVSELCSYTGRGRETRTHNPTLPKRVR